MSYKTNINKDKRNQLKSMMDEFTSFNWAGHLMYEDFGAFIVGGKDALKFYNGPKFTNQYAKPQFEGAAPLLTGVNFDTQKIEFTMGVYWFTIEEYRQLLMLLHPYEVNDLGFDFDPQWRYYAKLNSYQDSPRHFLGYDADGNRRYYTEIKLTFEVQGDSGMLARQSYQIEPASDGNEDESQTWNCNVFQWTRTEEGEINKGIPPSDLDTPFQLYFSFDAQTRDIMPGDVFPGSYLLPRSDDLASGYYIHLAVSIPLPSNPANTNEIGLCSFSLNNLSWINEGIATFNKDIATFNKDITTPDEEITTSPKLHFCFDSQTGLLTLQTGSGAYRLLSLTSSSGTGSRILQSLETNKCFLPGVLSSGVSQEWFNQIQFKIYYTSNLVLALDADAPFITSYARTNII